MRDNLIEIDSEMQSSVQAMTVGNGYVITKAVVLDGTGRHGTYLQYKATEGCTNYYKFVRCWTVSRNNA